MKNRLFVKSLNKIEVTASSSVLKLWAMSFNFFFILAHDFSIGFKSGEYGGRNNRLCYFLFRVLDERSPVSFLSFIHPYNVLELMLN